MKLMKSIIKYSVAVISIIGLIIAVPASKAIYDTRGRTVLEFDITQNRELIYFSDYGEPPQFAIWLNDTKTGKYHTVFVTHRAATGDWVGKTEIPAVLPLWYEIHKTESGREGLPTYNDPAIIAITGATPQQDHFKIRVEVEPKSEWDCYIEVNLAGDFNQYYREYGDMGEIIDEYADGQPAVVYKAGINAEVGHNVVPELVGISVLGNLPGKETVQPITEKITTAHEIFCDIKIKVIRPKPAILKWKYAKIGKIDFNDAM